MSSPSPSPPTFKIAIIGAGPGGLTLARLLHLSPHPLSITIFEGEVSPRIRAQGGTLDLHPESGQAALKKCGLYDQFLEHARFDGEAFVVCDKNLRKYVNFGGTKEGSSRGRPEIDRVRLREVLLGSLPEGMVKWSHRLQSVSESKSSSSSPSTQTRKFTLNFTNGTTISDFSLLIGADGAWSRVRPLVSDATPFYAGVGGLAFTVRSPETLHPALYKLVNRGSVFAFSDQRALMAQQMGDGSLHIGTYRARPEGWMSECGFDIKDAAAAKRRLLEEDFRDWRGSLKEFLEAAEEGEGEVKAMNIYMLPIGHRWEHRAGVTLLGDAAHLMGPFAGEGVNLAMSDAMKLAEAILAAAGATKEIEGEEGRIEVLSKKVEAFEEDMFRRATGWQEVTMGMMTDMLLTADAPNSTIERWIIKAAGHDMSWALLPLFKAGVYAYFCCWRAFGWGKTPQK
ncbi:FAD/NAD(P)-binding domain-containing protein [Aulographum hederae CBS 113979]|uniref:FAD/NAD(P)-binding domain-containing protein n=1 Tax=Aulographum hederae CBS 113979 TaxID=1176131 RepID=A0A6G1H3L2_9PEZI|nr:FAD/NAD(P)-binding domain-containing protein [Aulographum hederae CBS 113979]